MRSPPSSDDIFFSSPPRYTGSGPAEEVETLFAAARNVTTLNDNLAAIVKNNDAFFQVFARHVQLLKSRSQAFEDAHVTVYDKVLLMLTQHGNKLDSPAAITWYCTEFLGINLNHGNAHNSRVIEQVLAANTAVAPQAIVSLSPRPKLTLTDTNTYGSSIPALQPNSKNDPRFTHLWSVYSKACADYMAVVDKNDDTTLETARFLRDTAENGIHYLKGKYPHDPALTELERTLSMAQRVVVSLNGGKKRKFDHGTGDDVRPGGISLAPHTAHHDRNNGTRRRRRDRDAGKPKQRGRGPSGIPYGYSRPVDSYHPA